MVSGPQKHESAEPGSAGRASGHSTAAAWFDGLSVEGSSDAALAFLERDILPAYVVGRRWYGSKDAGRPTVGMDVLIDFPGGQYRMCVAVLKVEPPERPAQRYLLPLMVLPSSEAYVGLEPIASLLDRGASVLLVDAFSSDAFVRELLARIAHGDTQGEALVAGLGFRRTRALTGADELSRAEIRRSSAEQSNTSLRIGATAMLKGLRKLEAGKHPELEMSRYLTEVVSYPNTPALLAHVELAATGADATTLCVMQALIPNKGDGWSYVLDLLGSASISAKTDVLTAPLREVAQRLGQRTAELHHALSTSTEDIAFRPESVSTTEMQKWTSDVSKMATAALDGLQRQVSALDGDGRRGAEELLSRRGELMARIAGSAPRSAQVVRTRIHGDYHLGQVLIAEDDDVFIIDFEGEPMRPLEERRSKHSPLRDVAGMLRSLAYAAAVARADVGSGADAAERVARINGYGEQMAEVFLAAYRASIHGCPAYPPSPEAADQLLSLFLLDKALYEVAYEVANRPDWVSIPIAGVLGLLGSGGAASASP